MDILINLGNKINRWAGNVAAFLCLLLIFLTAQQVIARYFFNAPSNGLEELKWHLFGMVFLLSIGYTLQVDGHVRVDMLYQNWREKTQNRLNLITQIIIIMPLSMLMIYFGVNIALSSYGYVNPRPLDYFSRNWFPSLDGLYFFLSPIESVIRKTILQGEISSAEGGLEARWIIKAFIPLGFLLLFLQSFVLTISISKKLLQPEKTKAIDSVSIDNGVDGDS